MTFADLVVDLARAMRLPKNKSAAVLRAAFDLIGRRVIGGERVLVPGFGAFDLRRRKARSIAGPPDALGCTTTPMRLPASFTIGFRASKHLKKRANRKQGD